MSLLRPDTIDPSGARTLDHRVDPGEAVEAVLGGATLCATDRYASAVTVQTALHAALEPPAMDAGHGARRRFRRALREASNRLILPVHAGAIGVERAPTIGLLSTLYPEPEPVWLPVLDLQRLGRADTVFREGVHLAVLGQRLHPFWGTYVPTRTEHLELFGTWLSGWTGARHRAVDVGTGSGVLALMLAKAGFDVVATDTNPNALHSLQLELEQRPRSIQARQGDLLAGAEGPFDVIVFNPPWLRGDVDELLDQALHYEDPGLFERFFEQASASLAPDGRVVVVFSDIGRLVQPEVPHPLETELARGRFTLVDKLRRKVRGAQMGGTRRRTRERVEAWSFARQPGAGS